MQDLIKFVANHDDRKFGSRPLENIANNRRNASTAKKGEWDSWSDADKALVQEICGPLMEKYGYAPMQIEHAIKQQSAA